MKTYKYETHLHTNQGSACGRAGGQEYIEPFFNAGYSGIFVTDHFFGGNTAVPKEGNWLDKLPVGSKVRFTGNGQDIILTKHAPAFQFKTWFWYDEENHRYMKKKFVTSETAVAV